MKTPYANTSSRKKRASSCSVFKKLTLLDYRRENGEHDFLSGCNFGPFCQNSDLVFLPESMPELQGEDDVLKLSGKSGILDGVCISGGEPLLNPELWSF